MLKGAQDAFAHYEGLPHNLHIYRVPGAFEISGTIRQVLKYKKPHAVLALGAIIRGETPHFNYIAGESARGLSDLTRETDIPIINGILTTDNSEQAMERSEPNGRNKGWSAMEAAIQTISVYQEIHTDI